MALAFLNVIYLIHPLVLGAGLLAFFSVLWRFKRERSIRDALLLVLLFTFLVPTWDVYALHVLNDERLAINSWHAHALSWLGGPLLYVIVKSACFPNVSIVRYWPHTLPCVVFSFYFVLIHSSSLSPNIAGGKVVQVFAVLWIVMMTGYTLVAGKVLVMLNRERMHYVSSDLSVGEKRAMGLLLGYSVFVLADIGMALFYLKGEYPPAWIDIAFQLARLSYIVFLLGILQFTNFAQVPSVESFDSELSDKARHEKERNEKDTFRVSDDVAVKIAELLARKVDEEKLFLEPDIGLRDLAERIGVSAHNLSAVLNNHINMPFYLYINQRRIVFAKTRLEQTDDFITDIAIHSGFSSRSSFYNMFKKFTGMTPKQYREGIQKQ